MTPVDALRDLADVAARTIDWLQGYDVPDPLEELGAAVVRARHILEWDQSL